MIEEVRAFQRQTIIAGEKLVFNRYVHRLPINPALTHHTVWPMIDMTDVVQTLDLWWLIGACHFFLDGELMGEIKILKSSDYITGDQIQKLGGTVPRDVIGGGVQPAMFFEHDPNSTSVLHSATCMPYEIRGAFDEVGLFVGAVKNQAVGNNMEFVMMLRVLSQS